MDEKTLEKFTQEVNEGVKNLEKSLNGKASKTDVEGMQKGIDDLNDKIAAIEMVGDGDTQKKLGDYLETMQKHLDDTEVQVKEMALKAEESDNTFKALKELIQKDEFKENVKRKADVEYLVDMKKAIQRSSFTADSGTVRLDQYSVPGIVKDPWRDNPLFALITKQFVGEKVDSIKWYEESSRTDSAAGIAEAGTYPESTAAWVRKVEQFYKIGHYTQLTEESLEDSEYVMGEIQDLLSNGVNRKVEQDLYTGVNANNTINGLINATAQKAKDFAKPSGMEAVQDPNNYDVLKAARTQVYMGDTSDSNKRGYIAQAILMNPQNITDLHLQKDTDGNYILPPFASADGMMISGCRVIESFDITADKFLIGDFSKAKGYIKRNISLKTSDNVASTFLEDILTIKAAVRMAFVVPTKHEFAFVYGDFSDGRALIAV